MATTGPPPSSPERNAAAVCTQEGTQVANFIGNSFMQWLVLQAAQQLSNAAFNDQITEVEALLASGVPVDAKDPVRYMACDNNTPAVRVLLQCMRCFQACRLRCLLHEAC